MAKNGVKNLISFKDRTEDEQRELARMGGKRSGEVRRAKKTMRDTLQMLLDLKVADPKIAENLNKKNVKKSEQTNQTAIMMKLVEDTLKKGSLEQIDKILEILGQKSLTQEINVSVDSQTKQNTNAFLSAVKERPNGFDDE